jgi:hypothetical protein
MKKGSNSMKKINKFAIALAIISAIGISQPLLAQNFVENEGLWKTEIIRAGSIDRSDYHTGRIC